MPAAACPSPGSPLLTPPPRPAPPRPQIRAEGSSAQHDQALASLGVRPDHSAAPAGPLDPLLDHPRFAVRDVSGDAATPMRILVQGPRGSLKHVDVTAGTTVSQFMGTLDAEEAACELSVNGLELGGSPSTRLQPGDKVVLTVRTAEPSGAPQPAAARPNVVAAPLLRRPVPVHAAGAGRAAAAGLALGVPAAAGGAQMLDLYVPGQAGKAMEVALGRNLQLSTQELRMSTLAA